MDQERIAQPTTKATYAPKPSNAVKFYNDCSENAQGTKGAFFDIAQAIQQAKTFIFICDWSFHPRFRMTRTTAQDPTIGQLLLERADNGVLVAIHTWRHNPQAADDPNDQALETLKTIAGEINIEADLVGTRLLWRASRRHGMTVGYSHHQKFVALDAPVDPNNQDGERVIKVFFGGLDLTAGRLDWPDHILPQTGDTTGFFKPDDWYNGEFAADTDALNLPREPWHDIHGQLIGPAAWDFVYEFVGRWSQDPVGSQPLGHYDKEAIEAVWTSFVWLKASGRRKPKLYQDNEPVPQAIETNYGMPIVFSAQVVRSLHKNHLGAPSQYASDSEAQSLQWTLGNAT